MSKKGDPRLQNYDVLARMNYLYQAAHLLVGLSESSDTKTDSKGLEEEELNCEQTKKPTHSPEYLDLSRHYTDILRKLSKKAVIRMYYILLYQVFYLSRDPSVKRTLCKKCSALLVDQVSASITTTSMWSNLFCTH